MSDRRRRRERVQHRGGRNDEFGLGYYDAREAAMDKADYDAVMALVPHNSEAEAALLGALMIDNRLIDQVADKLQPAHFFEPTHGRIYERIVTLSRRGRTANPITLKPYFEGETFVQIDDAGNSSDEPLARYMAGLTGSGAALIGARQFAQQVVDLSHHRRLIEIARELGETAGNTAEEVNPRRAVQAVEDQLLELTSEMDAGAPSQGAMFDEGWDQTVADIEERAAGKPTTGFVIADYDDLKPVLGAIEPSEYTLLGGRPGMGKTGVSCKIAKGAAKAGHATAYLSLEMRRHLIQRRMIADEIYDQGMTSGYSDLSEGRLTDRDRVALANARARINGIPLYIDDPDEMMVEELAGWIRRVKRRFERRGQVLKLVVLDYLTRLGTTRQFRSGHEIVSHISRTVKTVARQEGVHIIALAQLSREVEKREDKRPLISDLRESGSLEQDADNIMFVYRDEYYLERSRPPEGDKRYEAWRDDMTASRDRLELYSVKRREGALARRTGYFYADNQAVRASDFFRSDLFRGDPGFGDAFGGG